MSSAKANHPRYDCLVTGGAGFIGSHLVDHLIERGDGVIVLDDLSTGSMDNLAHRAGHSRLRFERGSVRDAGLVNNLAADCERIFHLAAVVGVENVLADPLKVVEENIYGTRTVLEAARIAGARVFVASTSEIYGKNADVPYTETSDRVLGSSEIARWSYAASKAIDEILALGYSSQHGVPVVIGRFFNTIGRRQTGQYGMVVPRFIEQALAGRPVTVYGDGTQSRTFCDVRDSVRALMALMDDATAAGRPYNIGSRREITIAQLGRLVLETLAPEQRGKPDAMIFVPYEEAYAGGGYEEFPRRVPDTTRVQDQIGWLPEFELTDTLRWIAADLKTGRERRESALV